MSDSIRRGGQYTIELESGRLIHLGSLHQERTYAGLVVGLPNPRTNERCLREARKRYRAVFGAGTNLLMIPPEYKPVKIPKGTTPDPDLYPQPLLRLPEIVCMSGWESGRLSEDEDGDGSQLGILWYQERFAMPIAKRVVTLIRQIDWDQHARAFTF